MLSELIEALPSSDRERAERFAVRNGLRREYLRFQGLSFAAAVAGRVQVAEPEASELYFYGWRIGALDYLGAGEYRFSYDPEWPVPLSREFPLRRPGPSYEGRRMPAFFENSLPEGWTEAVVLASNKLSREDLYGLFSSTRKYLSNLTLRPLGIPDSELVYDAHTVRLGELVEAPPSVLRLQEEIGADPADPSLWRRTRADGPLRLSGAQAKLPVSLFVGAAGPTVRIGDLRHACTHILKVPASEHPGLVENEWVTMELARRIGLPVAPVARVEFPPESRYRGRSLLVERYDIPDRWVLERGGTELRLLLQEDASSLLLLRREDKYRTSLERVADALLSAGVDSASERGAMTSFLELVLFSWIVGNGDLHAKNISVLHRFRAGRPGEAPVPEGTELAPFYDLVNTRLHIPNDQFALPLNGRRANLRIRHFEALASRWEMPREAVRREVERIAAGVASHLDRVLGECNLTPELQDRYQTIVSENLVALGVEADPRR